MLPSSFSVIEFYFKSLGLPKRNLISKVSAGVVSGGGRIFAAFCGAPIWVIASISAVEAALVAAGLVFFYTRQGGSLFRWRIDRALVRELIRQIIPTALSALVVVFFFRASHLMLAHMRGYAELALFIAASQVVQVASLLPQLILSTFYPRLVRLHTEDRKAYQKESRLIFAFFAFSSYCFVFLVIVVGARVLPIVLGSRYDGIAQVLALLSLSIVFTYSGSARNQVLFIRDAQAFNLVAAAIGLVFLIPLNAFLIPRDGAAGAAIAVVSSQAISGIGTSFLFRSKRDIGKDQVAGLLLYPLFSYARERYMSRIQKSASSISS
jgi:PST family polysaccharide transporter